MKTGRARDDFESDTILKIKVIFFHVLASDPLKNESLPVYVVPRNLKGSEHRKTAQSATFSCIIDVFDPSNEFQSVQAKQVPSFVSWPDPINRSCDE